MKVIVENNSYRIDAALLYGAYLSKDTKVLAFHTIERICGTEDKEKVDYKLPLGRTQVIYNSNKLEINYEQTHKLPVGGAMGADFYERLTIQADNINIISQFFKDSIKHLRKTRDADEILTYSSHSGCWRVLSRMPKRNQDTVYLPKTTLEDTIKYVQDFTKSEEKYKTYGIPYKLNVLLSGPPGTGKTTLINTIASQLDKNIAILSIDMNLDDDDFMRLLGNIPENCIFVIEDIDTLFADRKPGDTGRTMVTLRGMLNALDGLSRKPGLITFITTNFVKTLDKALIRPGRIDKTIKFEFATKDQIKAMYDKFLPKQSNNWKAFYKKVRGLHLTPAMLQLFLFTKLECTNIMDEMQLLMDITDEEKYSLYM